MRKIILTVLSIAIFLMLWGCASAVKPALLGIYQSERDVNGYIVQITVQQDDSSFIEYIDSREVDRGTFEKAENNAYIMKSDKQNFEITLNDDNTFQIAIKKLNDGKSIQMKNVSVTPTIIESDFDDVDEYKALLD